MNLEQAASSLLEQFPTGDRAAVMRQERRLERFGQIAFGGFGLVIATAILGLLYLIFTKMILTGANFWSGLLLMAFIIFAGLGLTYVFLNESLKEKKQRLSADLAPGMREAPTGKLLSETGLESATSVTENTTDLLDKERVAQRR